MIGIDTNVIIRYLVQDDPSQAAAATEFIDALTDAEPGFVSLVTLVEVVWVLRRAYDVDAARCTDIVTGLLNARELRIEHSDLVRAALAHCGNHIEFADAVIAELGRVAGARHTVTFDRKAARLAEMRLLTAS